MEKKTLKVKGIHDVFDKDVDNSYEFTENGQIVGYVNYKQLENRTIWMELILASKRGNGYGTKIIDFLFNSGIIKIEGTSIYGPHFFWQNIGVQFSDEVEERICDGTYFVLTKEDFEKATKNKMYK